MTDIQLREIIYEILDKRPVYKKELINKFLKYGDVSKDFSKNDFFKRLSRNALKTYKKHYIMSNRRLKTLLINVLYAYKIYQEEWVNHCYPIITPYGIIQCETTKKRYQVKHTNIVIK